MVYIQNFIYIYEEEDHPGGCPRQNILEIKNSGR